MKNDMAVKTFTDYLYHLCNKNQLNLKNVDEFGDDFIQLQTFFHFEPIIYECFFLFVSGTAARSVRPLTLAHDNIVASRHYLAGLAPRDDCSMRNL